MTDETKKRLEQAGFKFGDYAEFLGLTEQEKTEIIERGKVFGIELRGEKENKEVN